ncbi:NACHT domain-containing protein [Acidisoma sp. 7E03]
MTRIVRQQQITPQQPEDTSPRLFSEYADRANIVLLGDPGAGKTHLFQETAAAQKALYVKARAFLNRPADQLQGQALFIDGLDERRAGRGDRDTVDALVVKLFDVAPPKVRISCRAADWLGESDLAAFAPFFDQQGSVCVLYLENLSRAEQVAVLAGQGGGQDEAERFLDEAAERGLGDFLGNPQNLIMLRRAVQAGSWPATRRDLFSRATELMLQETNEERARSGCGVFRAAELRRVAGAVCAARLISDVEAIKLTDQDNTLDLPTYRSLDLFPAEKVQAVLGRRIFDAASEAETVDYAHRMTAEFLAAEFLASRVREGLPLGRISALMGVDGHPAPELRGLHAWLAVHLPEHADELIEADPYGVVTYGDAASLSASSCRVLVRALDRLSRENPWFRAGNWQALPIGALARADMVSEFRAILSNPNSGFGVRSVVVDALALGPALPAMLPDLETILAREASPFAERTGALSALFGLGADGKAAIQRVFAAQLGDSVDALRLRTTIIRTLYGDPYGSDDVIKLVASSNDIEATHLHASLHVLAEVLPEEDLPTILDGIEVIDIEEKAGNGRWHAAPFYARILERAWTNLGAVNASRVLAWLHKRLAFQRGYRGSQDGNLRAAMDANPDLLRAVALEFFCSVPIDRDHRYAFHRFREATLFALKAGALAEVAMQAFEAADKGSDRRLFLYEVAMSLSYQMSSPQGDLLFDDLYQRAEDELGLGAVRDATTVAILPPNFFSHRSPRVEERGGGRARQREEFDQDIDLIRRGRHLGWLAHLAGIYFGLYPDTDHRVSPRDRLSAWLGEHRVNDAVEALVAALARNDLPSFEGVMRLTAESKHFDWWYALVAALNERWAAGQGLPILLDDFFKGILVFDITNPIFVSEGNTERLMIHPWREALMERRPELVRDAYLAVAQLRLSHNGHFVDGLREILNEAAFEPYRQAIVVDLLQQFPNAVPPRLADLLNAVVAMPEAHRSFLQLAGPVISGEVPIDQRQRDLWLVTAYVAAPWQFEQNVEQRATAHPPLVFDLRNATGFARRGQSAHGLPLPMLEFMARLTGRLFPDAPFPNGGAWGDTNPWDASEYFRALVNMISAMSSSAATDALQRLKSDPRLASYKPHLLYALANQLQRRREVDYYRPNWQQTISTLANRAPATVADLHALLVDHLRDQSHRIARANTDIFKRFWNVDSHARPTDPRPEETCRDDLITLLRPVLSPLGLTIEPEGHMVADKRADISVAMPNRKILCELKRAYHAEVWTAIEGQLERFYAHDPEAKGFGVYVVFWFGTQRAKQIPAPPNGMHRPTKPAEMEAMLQSLLPEDMRKRLSVVAIDVSGDV